MLLSILLALFFTGAGCRIAKASNVYNVPDENIKIIYDPNDFPLSSSPLGNYMLHVGKGALNQHARIRMFELMGKLNFKEESLFRKSRKVLLDTILSVRPIDSLYSVSFINHHEMLSELGEKGFLEGIWDNGATKFEELKDGLLNILSSSFNKQISLMDQNIAHGDREFKKTLDDIMATNRDPPFDGSELKKAVDEIFEKLALVPKTSWFSWSKSVENKYSKLVEALVDEIQKQQPAAHAAVDEARSIWNDAHSNTVSAIAFFKSFYASKRIHIEYDLSLKEMERNWGTWSWTDPFNSGGKAKAVAILKELMDPLNYLYKSIQNMVLFKSCFYQYKLRRNETCPLN